ncbi:MULTISPECIES: YbaB/EbfC family nucleoid-associated protein [Nonomuraea]|nr:YbaB/EbfC family nucleoid-associated protein [Nonomuraea sp. FMUSA5-5]
MPFDPAKIDLADLDRIRDEAQQTMRRLSGAEGELSSVQGVGSGASGLITVLTDGAGRVTKIDLNPRVTRLDSPTLAEELLRAIGTAQDEAARRTQELLENALGGQLPQQMFDPDRIEALLAESDASFAAFINEKTRRMGIDGGR